MPQEGSGVVVSDPDVPAGVETPPEPGRNTTLNDLMMGAEDPQEPEAPEENLSPNYEEEVFLDNEEVNPPIQVETVREDGLSESEAKEEELDAEVAPPLVTTNLSLTAPSTGHSLPPRRFSIPDDTPMRQTRRAELRDARAQSFGIPGRYGDYESDIDVIANEFGVAVETLEESSDGAPIIGGRKITVKGFARDSKDCKTVRLWDKEKRHELAAEARMLFQREATGPTLLKKNKFSAPSTTVPTGKQYLAAIDNLSSQVKCLKQHLAWYDLDDITTVVVPVSVMR